MKILSLSNIPEIWSVKSLAKIYTALYDIFGNQSHGSGEDIVKAVVEMTLTQDTNVINGAFVPSIINLTTTTNKRIADTSPLLELTTKNSDREVVAKFLTRKTLKHGPGHSNFKSCYMQTVGWAPYEFDPKLPQSKHTARAILSWFSSYIILQAYRKYVHVFCSCFNQKQES